MHARLRALAATVGLAAAACAARGPTPDPPADPRVDERLYTLGALHVELRIPDAPAGRKPVVLSPFVDPEMLLARGFVVASYQFDWKDAARLARGPGSESPPEPPAASEASPAPEPQEERVGAWLLASPRPGIVGRGYFQLVAASASSNLPAVLDLLEKQPEVDPRRIGIMGSSTFGFVALEALAQDPRLAAGVVRVACGDYLGFLRSSTLALADDPRWLPEGRLPLDADYEAELRARQPIDRADAYPPRPLLLLAGRTDRVMPFACVERTAEALSEAYTRAGVAERFRLESFSEEGHQLGPDADELALRWLERWLAEPAAQD